MAKHKEEKVDLHNEKYLAITAIAKRAKELARQHAQSHGIGGDMGYDPIDAAIEEVNREQVTAFKRNDLTGELEKF